MLFYALFKSQIRLDFFSAQNPPSFLITPSIKFKVLTFMSWPLATSPSSIRPDFAFKECTGCCLFWSVLWKLPTPQPMGNASHFFLCSSIYNRHNLALPEKCANYNHISSIFPMSHPSLFLQKSPLSSTWGLHSLTYSPYPVPTHKLPKNSRIYSA